MQFVSALLSGGLFGAGLLLSGMTQPGKVLAFLDFGGDWDPSLAFVMAGAIAVYAPLYQFITKRTLPLYAQRFVVAATSQLDKPLILGAAVFGVGWGLGGFCPGPGLVSAGSGALSSIVFVLCMLCGMILFEVYQRTLQASRARRERSLADGSASPTTAELRVSAKQPEA